LPSENFLDAVYHIHQDDNNAECSVISTLTHKI
jgi:hypothetical protein